MQTHNNQTTRAHRGNLRRNSQKSSKRSTLLFARTKELHSLWQQHKDRQARGQTAAIPRNSKPFVATARRVPWRRLHTDELDGKIQIWNAPEYKDV